MWSWAEPELEFVCPNSNEHHPQIVHQNELRQKWSKHRGVFFRKYDSFCQIYGNSSTLRGLCDFSLCFDNLSPSLSYCEGYANSNFKNNATLCSHSLHEIPPCRPCDFLARRILHSPRPPQAYSALLTSLSFNICLSWLHCEKRRVNLTKLWSPQLQWPPACGDQRTCTQVQPTLWSH